MPVTRTEETSKLNLGTQIQVEKESNLLYCKVTYLRTMERRGTIWTILHNADAAVVTCGQGAE